MEFITKPFIIFIIFYLHSYLSNPLALNKELEACYNIHSKNKFDTFLSLSVNKKLPPDSVYILKKSCKGSVNSMKKCSVESEMKFVPASDNNETFPSDSIYFLETSCKGGLDTRQACCVESAARSNPGRQVNLIFTKIVSKHFVKSAILNSLLQYRNVNILKIFPVQYAKGTPIESLFAKKEYKTTKYPVEHNSDVFRVLTLFKFGGVYLDTDVIVTKSFDTLPKNWLAKESDKNAVGEIMSFSKNEAGKNFTTAALKLLYATFRPNDWSNNGPKLMSRLVSQMCSNSTMKKTYETTCPGFTVFEPKNFYPIPWWEWKKYFEPDSGNRVLDEPYTYHFWNHLSKNAKITIGSLIDKLAKKFCPRIYKLKLV